MYTTAFLIITYGNNYLQECIKSIRNIYTNILICIVDNKQDTNYQQIYENKNILYSKNTANTFELGSIWHAVKTWTKINKFIIFQNSFILLKPLPKKVFNSDYTPLWTANASDYSPVVPWVENKLKKVGIEIEYNKIWNSICGCCCIINTFLLKKLITMNFDDLYATNKGEAVGCEILFGYMIHNILGIDAKPLHEYPIYTYVHNKQPWVWIKKMAIGQGINTCVSIDVCVNEDLFKNVIFTNVHSRIQCYIDILRFTDSEKNCCIQNWLLSVGTNNLKITDNKFDVLPAIKHRMFTKKYFRDHYENEKNKIF